MSSRPWRLVAVAVLLAIGLLTPISASSAADGPGDFTTSVSVVATNPEPGTFRLEITVTVADGSVPHGSVSLQLDDDPGYWDVYDVTQAVTTVTRSTHDMAGITAGDHVVRMRYTPSNSTAGTPYTESATTAPLHLAPIPTTLFLDSDNIGKGVLQLTAWVRTEVDGFWPAPGDTFLFEVDGREPMELAMGDQVTVDGDQESVVHTDATAQSVITITGLPKDASYRTTVTFVPGPDATLAGSQDSQATTLKLTKDLTATGFEVKSPQRGVVKVLVAIFNFYDAPLHGTVVLKDVKTGETVATLRHVQEYPKVSRTVVRGVTSGKHTFQTFFTPDRELQGTVMKASSPQLKLVVK